MDEKKNRVRFQPFVPKGNGDDSGEYRSYTSGGASSSSKSTTKKELKGFNGKEPKITKDNLSIVKNDNGYFELIDKNYHKPVMTFTNEDVANKFLEKIKERIKNQTVVESKNSYYGKNELYKIVGEENHRYKVLGEDGVFTTLAFNQVGGNYYKETDKEFNDNFDFNKDIPTFSSKEEAQKEIESHSDSEFYSPIIKERADGKFIIEYSPYSLDLGKTYSYDDILKRKQEIAKTKDDEKQKKQGKESQWEKAKKAGIEKLDFDTLSEHLDTNFLFTDIAKGSSKGGYKDHSKSNRALLAEQNGQFPKSKWGKEKIQKMFDNGDIVFSDDDDVNDYVMESINKLSDKEIKDHLIMQSSWHHTGTLYNETDYYGLDSPYGIMDYIMNNRKKFNNFKKKTGENENER